MRNFFNRLNEVNKMIFVAALVGVILCLFSLVGVFLGQVGWLIGVSIGSIIEIFNIYFLYKGSDVMLKEGKTSLFLFFYFIRMFLFAGGIVLCVIMQYVMHINAFVNSFWGVLIGFTPMQIIVMVIMTKTGKSPLNMKDKIE